MSGRFKGLLLTVLVEALFVLVVLTLGASVTEPERRFVSLTSVSFSAASPSKDPPAKTTRATPDPAQAAQSAPARANSPQAETHPQQVAPPPVMPRLIQLAPADMAAANIAALPRPSQPVAGPRLPGMGPPDTAIAAKDTPRVGGSGPNGEPLYAASWYREPYDDELRGYLSTASGPGWGLIACRTVPDYRVEDCFAIDEYPNGSNIARAVLAAAWQFRVRPPRLGGQVKVGE